MGRTIMEMMPKPEIPDPQGRAIGLALPRLGITSLTSVRQGKCFHLSIEGLVAEELLAQVRAAVEKVLLNPIIEDVARVETLPEGETK